MFVHWRFVLSLFVFLTSFAILARLESGGGDTFTDLNCVTPDAILDVQLMSGNGSLSVNFSWTFENENNAICHHVYSVRSFRSPFPYDYEDKREPSGAWHYTGIKYMQVNQQTHYIFGGINRASYYQFELRIQTNLGTTSPRVYRYFSFLYYFGDQVPAEVVEPASNDTVIRARLGDSITLPCSGTGIPVPSIWVVRHPDLQPPFCSSWCTPYRGDYIALVREYHSGEYFCVATNTLVNPPLGKRNIRNWKRMELIVEPVPTNVSYSQCLPYIQSMCDAFLDSDFLVFIDDPRVINHKRQLHNQVRSLFQRIDRRANRSEVSSLDHVLHNKCHRLAQSIACHSVYPYCDSDFDVPTPRLICKTMCDAFSAGGICEKFISEAETPELYLRLTTKCDTREHPAGSSPECIPIDFDTAQTGHSSLTEQTYSWCTHGNEHSYTGNVHRTRSGWDCQPWASQVPHQHPFWPSKYSPELNNDTSACRNPGGVGEGPWCYTNDPNTRWEYCEVPQCGVCQQYEGDFCHGIEGYNHGNWTVYIDRNSSKWGPLGLSSVDFYLKNLLRQVTVDTGDDIWAPGCEHALRQLLCHAILPFCKKQELAAPLMACGGCQLLDTIHFCSTEVYHHLVQVLREEHSYFQPDDCLPAAATDNISFIGPDCMPLPHRLSSRTDDCYSSSDHGQSYTGHLATTQRGERCQSWSEPHLLFHPGLYPELEGAANLCRNPGQLKDRIWCFTSESAWDYCLIPSNCTVSQELPQNDTCWTIPTVVTFLTATCIFIIGIASCFLASIGRKYYNNQKNSKFTPTSQTI